MHSAIRVGVCRTRRGSPRSGHGYLHSRRICYTGQTKNRIERICAAEEIRALHHLPNRLNTMSENL